MNRIEEYNFHKDVYTALIKTAKYVASVFLANERKKCHDDSVFFYCLLNETDQLLGRALKKRKIIAAYTEEFLNNYKKAINDPTAILVYIHKDDINYLSDKLIKSMIGIDTHFKKSFDRYWKNKCQQSLNVLYYRYLVTDPDTPKYEGLGSDDSKLLYNKIRNFVNVIMETLEDLDNPESTKLETTKEVTEISAIQITEQQAINDADEVRFLAYVYDKIVAPEFPEPATLLAALRSRSQSEKVFFDKLLKMDTSYARKEMNIGEISAKEVIRLGDIMRRIVSHPGSRIVFFNAEKAALAAPIIDRRLESEQIRVYHSYQNFLESCHGSMVDFYLSVVGLSDKTVKFHGLSHNASISLLNIFSSLLPEIYAYASSDVSQSDISFMTALIQLRLSDKQVETILCIAKKCGHYPVFTTLSYLIDNGTDDRQKEIIRRSLKTVYGKQIEELNDLAQSLNLSRERVRQLREECLEILNKYPLIFKDMGLFDGYKYETQSDYDFNRIREEEKVDFSNEYITVCIPLIDSGLTLLGDARKALIQTSVSASHLYLVHRRAAEFFNFNKFLDVIDEMVEEKRFYPYRDDLETFIRVLLHEEITNEDFYAIVRECRQILEKGYPNNIINSQVYFPANARKTIPNIIEDILREHNRPMSAEEICEELNKRYPDLEQIPSKIGSNALRNGNIVAVSRSSTYALAEWDHTEKRGGTIRDLAVEYLNSLFQPIAPLSDICDYIAKFRENVKDSSVKANLLAEANNRFGLYYKDDVLYIGFTDRIFGKEYEPQEKRQARRSFKDSIGLLEQFIKANDRFPYTSGVEGEEARLSRFYSVAKGNQKKGALSTEECAELKRIDETYGHLRVKKERVTWDEKLERFAKYITETDSLPCHSSKEYAWFVENKALYEAGELDPVRAQSFSFLLKILRQMILL